MAKNDTFRSAKYALPFRQVMAGIALISGVVNVLALTSPLFMLQVYDRVLSSGSVPTLVGLAILAAGLYAIQSLLDVIRSRVLLRIGESFDGRFSDRVHEAVVRLPLLTPMQGDGLQPLRDLDNVRGFLSGNGTPLEQLARMTLSFVLKMATRLRIGEAGSARSAGQRQRIGLARALYGNPFLVVLDEPNANLDAEGEAAVVRAITLVRERKGIAIVVAHRPSAIGAVDMVLMMESGRQKAFGPRDAVLSTVLKTSPSANSVDGHPSMGGAAPSHGIVASLAKSAALERDGIDIQTQVEDADVKH